MLCVAATILTQKHILTAYPCSRMEPPKAPKRPRMIMRPSCFLRSTTLQDHERPPRPLDTSETNATTQSALKSSFVPLVSPSGASQRYAMHCCDRHSALLLLSLPRRENSPNMRPKDDDAQTGEYATARNTRSGTLFTPLRSHSFGKRPRFVLETSS